MIFKRRTAQQDDVFVTFEIPGSVWAESIHLVGDFNEWDRYSLPFRRSPTGTWQVQLKLDAGHRYRFRYLIDGDQWRADLSADGYALGDDGHCDSVIIAQVTAEGEDRSLAA
jgi:1,4-alpha-glucan branching enzyme